MSDTEQAVSEFKQLMADPAARQAFVEIRRAKEAEGARADYTHVLRAVFGSPWAIREEWLDFIADTVLARARGERVDAEIIAQRVEAARRPARPASPQGVAVIPLHGVIIPKASMFSEMSGGTSIETFRSMFRGALASPEISSIVMDVDSPGGMVDQVPEMAAEIRAARGIKPITAVANTEAASAAYWLAAQADELVVSKSSRVGSIGVFTAHKDKSVSQEQKGVKTTLISAGRYKVEGNPFEPLSEDGKAAIQGLVNDYYGMFVSDVAKARGVPVDAVRSGFGEGRIVGARDAVAQGMADRVGSLDQVLGERLAMVSESAQAVRVGELIGPVRALTSPEGRLEASDEELEALQAETQSFIGSQFVAAVDNSSWDGNRAMTECQTASDFSSICAGEHSVGQPDERQHWALPHHYLGRGPNAEGVRQALSRLPQTQDLTNRDGAQSHLDAHMQQVNPDASAQKFTPETEDLDIGIGMLRDDPSPEPFE